MRFSFGFDQQFGFGPPLPRTLATAAAAVTAWTPILDATKVLESPSRTFLWLGTATAYVTHVISTEAYTAPVQCTFRIKTFTDLVVGFDAGPAIVSTWQSIDKAAYFEEGSGTVQTMTSGTIANNFGAYADEDVFQIIATGTHFIVKRAGVQVGAVAYEPSVPLYLALTTGDAGTGALEITSFGPLVGDE